MRSFLKLTVMLLSVVLLLCTLVACGGDDITESTVITDAPETEAPETEAPETEAPDTDVPSTDAPDTDVPETEPVTVDPELNFELLNLDFETDLALADYIAATEGIAINDALNGGEIKDGKWVYTGKALAIKDELGVYSMNYYSVEFDFCFNTFVNKDATSVFTFITDDDGVLNGDTSSFYIPFKLNMNGVMYHNNASALTYQLEAGKTYHFKAEVNNIDGKIEIFIDGMSISAPNYSQSLKEYQCFRIMDNNRGADMWVDNFKITDTEAAMNASTDKLAMAVDGAYVRGGKYANEAQGLAEGIYVDMKNSGDRTYYREGFIKFDISKLNRSTVKYTMLTVFFKSINAQSTFDLYWVDSDWDSETLTYNNAPQGEKIAENIKFSAIGQEIDLTPFIREALGDGDEYFSLRIVPVVQPTDGQTRLRYENGFFPSISVFHEKPTNNYFKDLTGDEAKNKEIWDYAQQMYDEWYARYQALPEINEDAVKLGRDESQYTKTNYMSGQSTNYATSKTEHKSRPFEALTDFDDYVSNEFKNAKLDKYGGIMIESLKQKATGFFYTTKIDGRWWMIDPLGYPYISIGLSDVHYSQLGSKLQKENALKLYGNFATWAVETTKQVRDELYFNNSFRPVSDIIEVKDNGLPFGAPVSFMGSYGQSIGVLGDGNGSTVFIHNNTMPVFDPAFVLHSDNRAKTQLKYAGNDRLIGYMSDNELPMNADLLDRAISINHTESVNWYTYACTWTWLCNITGKENPGVEDITDELRDLYRGFVYDRYFYVVSNAIKKYDSDHMYLGCRFLTVSNQSDWVFRFASQYVDCMTINWYGDWEPSVDGLYRIAQADIPFVITEFYTKAGDSGLGNTSGAGRFVATQTDRADFYETFVIRLLETNNCVGWQWFQYMDNDPNSGTGDASSVDSNKGIYRSDFTLYTELTDRMTILNKNVYNIIDYFANKNAK